MKMDADKEVVLGESILPPFTQLSDQTYNKPEEQKMKEEKAKKSCCESCCETFCDCFGKTMECCLPCALCCFLLER